MLRSSNGTAKSGAMLGYALATAGRRCLIRPPTAIGLQQLTGDYVVGVLRGSQRLSPPTGTGVAAHAGTRLLADHADATGLTHAFSDALARLRQRETGARPGPGALAERSGSPWCGLWTLLVTGLAAASQLAWVSRTQNLYVAADT